MSEGDGSSKRRIDQVVDNDSSVEDRVDDAKRRNLSWPSSSSSTSTSSSSSSTHSSNQQQQQQQATKANVVEKTPQWRVVDYLMNLTPEKLNNAEIEVRSC